MYAQQVSSRPSHLGEKKAEVITKGLLPCVPVTMKTVQGQEWLRDVSVLQ